MVIKARQDNIIVDQNTTSGVARHGNMITPFLQQLFVITFFIGYSKKNSSGAGFMNRHSSGKLTTDCNLTSA